MASYIRNFDYSCFVPACSFPRVPNALFIRGGSRVSPFPPVCPLPKFRRGRANPPRRFLFPRFNVFIRIRDPSMFLPLPARAREVARVTGKNRGFAKRRKKKKEEQQTGAKRNEKTKRSRTKKEKKEGVRAVFSGWRATRTIRHPQFNLTSHLCYCETTELATVEPHQSGLLRPVAISLTYLVCPFPFCLAASRGCKCHWRHSVVRRTLAGVPTRLNCFTICRGSVEIDTLRISIFFFFLFPVYFSSSRTNFGRNNLTCHFQNKKKKKKKERLVYFTSTVVQDLLIISFQRPKFNNRRV